MGIKKNGLQNLVHLSNLDSKNINSYVKRYLVYFWFTLTVHPVSRDTTSEFYNRLNMLESLI